MVCDIGISRLSMGVQSFDPGILSKMHRAHDRDQAQTALNLIKDHSRRLNSWSADLIYGNPGQTLEMLEADIKQLLSFDPPHISAYSLTLEDRTRLNKEVELGKTKMPDQDRVAEHAELVSRRLLEVGYEHYEVSSYAKPGHRAVHNHRYWNHVEYLGFGPSAHSFLWESFGDSGGAVEATGMSAKSAEATAIRWAQPRELKQYLSQDFDRWKDLILASNNRDGVSDTPNESKPEIEPLTLRDLAEERIMLAFRTKDGLTVAELNDRYGMELSETHLEWLEQKQLEGLIDFSGIERSGRITLTEKGLVIADHLTIQFISI
jgi:oxygen-independent coproporphyrinogen-3 oxidase